MKKMKMPLPATVRWLPAACSAVSRGLALVHTVEGHLWAWGKKIQSGLHVQMQNALRKRSSVLYIVSPTRITLDLLSTLNRVAFRNFWK